MLSTVSKLIGSIAAFALIGIVGPGTTAGSETSWNRVYEGGATAVSIDLDPFGDSANSPTSLGSREDCAALMPNGSQDGDEDDVDSITLDLTITDVPATHPVMAFEFTLLYEEAALSVGATDARFFLDGNSGSDTWNVSAKGRMNHWIFSAIDVTTNAGGAPPPEYGSGVLVRAVMSSTQGVSPRLRVLTVIGAHIDPYGEPYYPRRVDSAMIAIGTACPAVADSDADGANDIDEVFCGADPFDAAVRPEILGNGSDDDGNGAIDELDAYLSTSNYYLDCDGDGYPNNVERHAYGFPPHTSTAADRTPCGQIGPSAESDDVGWPADIEVGGSEGRVNIYDMAAFAAPVRHLGIAFGDPNFLVRLDLVPDNKIDVKDIASLVTVAPPMLGGVRAFNGPQCPWPP